MVPTYPTKKPVRTAWVVVVEIDELFKAKMKEKDNRGTFKQQFYPLKIAKPLRIALNVQSTFKPTDIIKTTNVIIRNAVETEIVQPPKTIRPGVSIELKLNCDYLYSINAPIFLRKF